MIVSSPRISSGFPHYHLMSSPLRSSSSSSSPSSIGSSSTIGEYANDASDQSLSTGYEQRTHAQQLIKTPLEEDLAHSHLHHQNVYQSHHHHHQYQNPQQSSSQDHQATNLPHCGGGGSSRGFHPPDPCNPHSYSPSHSVIRFSTAPHPTPYSHSYLPQHQQYHQLQLQHQHNNHNHHAPAEEMEQPRSGDLPPDFPSDSLPNSSYPPLLHTPPTTSTTSTSSYFLSPQPPQPPSPPSSASSSGRFVAPQRPPGSESRSGSHNNGNSEGPRNPGVQRVIQHLVTKEVPSGCRAPTAEELFNTILFLSVPRNSKLLHEVRVTGAPPLKSNSIYLLIGRASSSKYTPKLGGRRQSTRFTSEDGCTLHYRDSSVLRTEDMMPIVVREYQILPPSATTTATTTTSSSTSTSSSSKVSSSSNLNTPLSSSETLSSTSSSSSSSSTCESSSTNNSTTSSSGSLTPSGSQKRLHSSSLRGQKRSPPRLSSHLYTSPPPQQQQQQQTAQQPCSEGESLRNTPQVALLLRILICRPATTIEGDHCFSPSPSVYSPPSPYSASILQSPPNPPPLSLEATGELGHGPQLTMFEEQVLASETERALEEENRKRHKPFPPEVKTEKRPEFEYNFRLEREKVEEEKRVLQGLLRDKEAEANWLQRKVHSLQGEAELIRKKLEELEQQLVHSWFA